MRYDFFIISKDYVRLQCAFRGGGWLIKSSLRLPLIIKAFKEPSRFCGS